MKKICFLFLILVLFAGVAHAYIETDDFTHENFTKNEGYSDEIYRLIRLTTNPEQVRKEKKEYQEQHKVKVYLKKIYKYIDPYMDSGDFGRDDIKFYPTWDEI